MYKLFTDKTEIFECDINLTGASLSKTNARLVIESTDFSILFNGSVSSSGKCSIPIKKLRGLIDENTKGSIKLEIIAEDTYFIPWESDFEVEQSKRVTVEVKSQTNKSNIGKPHSTRISVSGIKDTRISLSEKQHVLNILKLLIKEKINIKNLSIKRNKLNNVIAEYVSKHPVKETGEVIDTVVKVLAKRK